MDNDPVEYHSDHVYDSGPAFPESQELFSYSECDTETDRQTDVTRKSSPSCDDSLFSDQITCTPTRTRRKRQETSVSQSVSQFDSSDSSDLELPSSMLTINDIFGPKKKKKKKKNRIKRWMRKPSVTRKTSKQSPTILKQKRHQRWLYRGIRFPFTTFKYLPFKLYFPFEQFLFGGFLKHMQKINYKRKTQAALKNIGVGDVPQDGDLEMLEHSYMDDDDPISPISESAENVNSDEDDINKCDIKIVDNSSFILDSQIPDKHSWQLKKKKTILEKISPDLDSAVTKKD